MYRLSPPQHSSLEALKKRKEFQNYTFLTTFAERDNLNCPRCQKPFSVLSDQLQDVGSFNVHVFLSKKLAIPYMLCKSCSHKMKSEPPVLRSRHNQKIDSALLNWLKNQ